MTKELLYYKPRMMEQLASPEFPGTETLSWYFKIYTAGAIPIDRTGTIVTPVRTKSLFPMPAFVPMKKTYEEICNERAKDLLSRAERLNAPVYVLWSGGIDSTLVLVSLLKNATPEQKKTIIVLMSEISITENPRFYDEHIRGVLKTATSSSVPSVVGNSCMLISGEHNDQIFGSDIMIKLIVRHGNGVLHEPYTRDRFFQQYAESIEDPAIINRFLDLFEKLRGICPIPLTSNFDFAWWINFSLKWQAVNVRMLTFVAPERAATVTAEYVRDYFEPFYNTVDFQLWSLNNHDKKIKDEWRTYKWVCKEIIYDFTGDAEYRDNKLKRGSLGNFVKQVESFTFLDSEYKLYNSMAQEEFYVPNNDFIL